MHFLSFAYKRAHYTSLAMGRALAENFGLTSARFDLLYCVRKLRSGAFQAAIARSLGVAEVTVSRMVRAMERSGLIRREGRQGDTRKRYIRLTNRGRRRYYLLLRKLQRLPLHRVFVRMIARVYERPTDVAYMRIVGAAYSLRVQMKALGDRASFEYPDWNVFDH